MADALTVMSIRDAKHACPRCGQPVASQGRWCASCRWQRARLSAPNSADHVRPAEEDPGPFIPENMVVPLGERLVRQGLLDDRALQRALEVQAQRKLAGESVMLGHLLVQMGLISSQALDRAVVRQSLELQIALQESNRQLERRVSERTAQLKQALVKLNELSQLKADFVAAVSHELRTPLTLLIGYVDMLASEALGSVNNDQAAALKSASSASKRLRSLVEDLLQFSELAHNGVALELAPVALGRLIILAKERVADVAEEKGIRLVEHLPAQLPKVNADSHKLAWVIGEFLDNAIKFSPSGGKVIIRASADHDQIEVAVLDSGIGIPQERMKEIFIPFHQLDGSTKRHYRGTGLGLALAQKIVEAHGSSIEVQSEVGRGSRFAFVMPAAS